MEPKVVFHVDEMQKWDLLLSNAANLLKSYDSVLPTVKIEVLANSEAVQGYLQEGDTNYFSAMETLSQKGIRFVACHNALQGMKITRGQIFQFVEVVPAGVRELIERQMEGYAYIKP